MLGGLLKSQDWTLQDWTGTDLTMSGRFSPLKVVHRWPQTETYHTEYQYSKGVYVFDSNTKPGIERVEACTR